MSIDLYGYMNGMNGYDPYREKFEQEAQYLREMARQQSMLQKISGMRDSPLAGPPKPVPPPEPNKVLLLLGEDA